jgi:uncharacterized membrane protein YeaQ/YmgE (transglycosylase-associated protein family)
MLAACIPVPPIRENMLPEHTVALIDFLHVARDAGQVKEGRMVGFLIWLVIGGVVGWLASIIMRTDAQQGIFLNIVVGIVGAFIGGLLFGGNINSGVITPMTFLVSLLGAVILLAIVNLVRRGAVR